MKKIITTILSAAFIPAVLADEGYGMIGYKMGSHMYGTGLYGAVYLILASFIFSIIFWVTYLWLVKNQKNKKKK